jgi:parvulin-like peptidyl-prolyl isomerase
LKSKIGNLFTNKSETEKNELLYVEKVNEYVNNTLYKNLEVNEHEIRKYYYDNKDKYRRNAEVLLYEIMLNDKKRANEIRAILNTKPYKFSEFAKKESVSKIAKPDGSLGYIEVDALPETFRKFIKSARLNKVTPVVQLLYGNIKGKKIYTYHIFKVVKRKRKRLLFFSKVKDSIKEELLLQKKDDIYRNFIKKLSNKIKVKVITDNLFFKYKKK